MSQNTTNLSGALGPEDDFEREFEAAKPAAEFKLLPKGNYECHVVRGKVETTPRTKTRHYQVTFEVVEGAFKGRRIRHPVWLTPKAASITKRDLAKLGITKLSQLDAPMPAGIRCNVHVTVRTQDDEDGGEQYNEVRSFEFVRIDKVEADPLDEDDQHIPI